MTTIAGFSLIISGAARASSPPSSTRSGTSRLLPAASWTSAAASGGRAAKWRPISPTRASRPDLSPRLIEEATRLGRGVSNLEFSTQNVLDDSWPLPDNFDAIVLLDVYEHIPSTERRLAR